MKLCFNGATSSQTWKYLTTLLAGGNLEEDGLQWSHVFSDMEITDLVDKVSKSDLGFNGATSSQTWK